MASIVRSKTDFILGGLVGVGLATVVCAFYFHSCTSINNNNNNNSIGLANKDKEDSATSSPSPSPSPSTSASDSVFVSESVSKSLSPSAVRSNHVSRVGTPLSLSHESYGECVYADYNATTPVYAEVCASLLPFLNSRFGNPSSSHCFGRPCKQALDEARLRVGSLVNAQRPAEEIVFTSCGTESDNRAVDIALNYYRSRVGKAADDHLPTVVTSAVEHPAILSYLNTLVEQGVIMLKIIGVTEDGIVRLPDLINCLSRTTALVTVMHSNNEVGSIQPIRAIGHAIAAFNQRENVNVLFHSDAAQSIGKIPVDVQVLGVDMLTIVGHKFGAPKGIAALYIKKGITKNPMLVGGGQEGGFRAGTENIAYAVGLGEASRIAQIEINEFIVHTLTLKLKFLQLLNNLLAENMNNVRLNGPSRANEAKSLSEDLKILKVMLKPHSSQSALKSHHASRASDIIDQLPNTISISFRNLIGHELVACLDGKVACSAGSACHSVPSSDSTQKSHYSMSNVLRAMNVVPEFGMGTLRISFGRHTTSNEVEKIVAILAENVNGVWNK